MMVRPALPGITKFEVGWGKPQAAPGRLRAAIMCRLSRDHDDSTSIATQEDDARTLCRLRGWDVVLVTYDVGVSGSIRPEERPGFGYILGHLSNIDVVVARSVDRFTRMTAHFAGLVETLDKGGTTLVDVQGQVDLTSPYGRFVTTIMVAFAQMEREMIQNRILRSRGELRQAGKWLGGAAPYGYRIVPDGVSGKKLAIDDYAAGVLREVIARVISGVTLSSEVLRLNGYTETRDGVEIQHKSVLAPGDYRKGVRGELPPPFPGYATWTYSALYAHLRSEVLRGYRVVGKRSARRAVRDEHGRPVFVGPPLVTDDVWRALQAALDRAASNPRRPRRVATLLLHIAWCPRCDETLYYNSREYDVGPRGSDGRKTGSRRSDIYTCTAARLAEVRKLGKCPGLSIDAGRLEETVREWFLTRFGGFDYSERVLRGGSDVTAEIAELTADIEELAESLAGLRGAAKDAVMRQLSSRQDALEELQGKPVEAERWEWVPTGRTVLQEWESRGTAERRLMLLSYGVRAEIDPAYGVRVWNPDRIRIDVHQDDPEAAALDAILREEAE